MIKRRCGTCKHFEAAPMWKKGWCRNPLLYSPQQSHLVGEDDLDCNRGMGSYWEAPDGDLDDHEPVTRFAPPPPRTIAPAPPRREGGAAPAGGGFPRRDRDGAATTPIARPPARRPAPLATASPETYQEAPAAHYSRGDYLRRGFPAIAIVLMVGLLWFWMSQQLGDVDGAAEPTPLATVQAGLSGAPPSVITPTAAAAQTPAGPTATVAPPPGVIAPGARVVVSASGAGANIRQGATTGSNRVTTLADGAALTITGESRAADGYTWWPVRGDGVEGWIAESLITPAE